MTLVTNNFEGGTDGTTITTANSGGASGTAFDAVNFDATGTPGVVAFSNVQKRGTLAARFQVGSVGAITSVDWQAARGSLTDDFVRCYAYLTTAFTISQIVVRWFSGALAEVGRIQWNADGTLSVINNSGTAVATSTTTIPTGQWARIEAQHHCDTAASFITVRMFVGANLEGVTADQEFGTSATFTGPTTTSARVDFGLPQGSASQPPSSGFLYLDDLAAGGTTWLGPTIVNPGLALREPRLTFGPF